MNVVGSERPCRLFVAACVPLLVAVAASFLHRTLKQGRDHWPFLIALGLFLFSFVSLGISIFPDVVPGRVTVWQAASPHSNQVFILVGASVLIR